MPATTRSQKVREAITNSNTSPQKTLVEHNNEPFDPLPSTSQDEPVHDSNTSSLPSDGDRPPRFVINLSLPPEQRYIELCHAYRRSLANLTPLFDEVMAELAAYIPMHWLKRIFKLFLRRVYDDEETRELAGISAASGVEMYLLVCFNVLLDLFMGCSSGGAAILDDHTSHKKMMHFRTLDWGMPSLRKIIVQLDFVAEEHGQVLASTISYVGYVGVLTGVRKGLSISLNFRPTRNKKGEFWSDLRYCGHLLLVLTGWRRSVSSHIRRFVIPRQQKSLWKAPDFAQVIAKIGGGDKTKAIVTTACYFCVSDGGRTVVFEKDLRTAVVRSSEEFVVVTNNDLEHEKETKQVSETETSPYLGAISELIYEAKDRRRCAEDNYQRRLQEKNHDKNSTKGLAVDDVVWLVQRYPTTNQTTHFACVMDATEGTIPWSKQFKRPVTAKWIREHED